MKIMFFFCEEILLIDFLNKELIHPYIHKTLRNDEAI